ncbi:hypothetical protein HPB48_008469 [Haemaphysalis longicornis]|uniref:Ig-like domain-containing protein n=1 Tax=Haemaphysalis longicornis TaxID=44386 RepID=A0A9J6FML1_HAELO|nr:hypothetical protein HPB48_008469 [Haemaphysalis longicornis]
MPFSFDKNIALGEKIVLPCAVTRGTGPYEIRWTHEGKPVTNTNSKYATPLTGNIATLTIEKVTAEDVGNYTCIVTNDVGKDAVTATLLVQDPPKIQPFFFPSNHPIGRDLTVSCFATEGQPPLAFTWLKAQEKIDSGAKFVVKQPVETMSTLTIQKVSAVDVGNYTCQVSNDAGNDRFTASLVVTDGRPFPVDGHKAVTKMVTESVSVLTVIDVGAADIGNYTCRATNPAGSDSFTAELIVPGRPAIMPFSFHKNAKLGQKMTVACVVSSGAAPLHFAWTHGEHRITSTSRRHVKTVLENVAALTIEAISAEDLGNYTCTVSNAAGSTSYSAVLVVQEPPHIQPFAFPKNPPPNSNMVISCNAHIGTEPINFVWFKDGQELQSASKVKAKIISETAPCDVEYDVTKREDRASNRKCYRTKNLPGGWATSHHAVLIPKNAVLRQKTTITCVVSSGVGPFEFVWTHEGNKVASDSRKHVKIFSESVAALTIEAISAEDLGNYTCTVLNLRRQRQLLRSSFHRSSKKMSETNSPVFRSRLQSIAYVWSLVSKFELRS